MWKIVIIIIIVILLILIASISTSTSSTASKSSTTNRDDGRGRRGSSRISGLHDEHDPQPQPPNIILLVVESTDGRTFQRGYQDDVIPLTNIRKLEEGGEEEGNNNNSNGSNKGGGVSYSFYKHYSNIPVCCPSRASFWSGKFPHKIQHLHNNMTVDGVWNNYEGLPSNYSNKIFDLLQRERNYDIKISGKQDWVSGGHSLNVQLNSWTMYTQFPYNIPKWGGWNEEEELMCRTEGIVDLDDNGIESKHWRNDWKNVNDTIDWIRNHTTTMNNNSSSSSSRRRPFFAYQGMTIAHPAYVTNNYWFNTIDPKKIQIPEWKPLKDLHPCDLQSTMLKGCLPISSTKNHSKTRQEEEENFYSIKRRIRIRQIYYAMINEFDAMVGRYMKAIDEMKLKQNTIFIITSDHGDMQMEHQQFYKHVPYDPSTNVPLIIYDPTRKKPTTKVPVGGGGSTKTNNNNNIIINTPTQHVDLFPTIMDFAGIPKSKYPPNLDGYSLLSFMENKDYYDHNYGNDENNDLLLPTTTTSSSSSSSSSSKAQKRSLNHDDHLQQQFYQKQPQGQQQRKKRKRPDFVVSQLHGVHVAMSWFAIIRPMPCVDNHQINDYDDYDNHGIIHASTNNNALFVRKQQRQEGRQNLSATHDGNTINNITVSTTPSSTTAQGTNENCIMKLVTWGTGKEVESQLFDITNDPNEMINLISRKEYTSTIRSLDAKLRSVVDYEKVALDVAKYNKQSFKKWIERNPTNWTNIVQNSNLRWHRSWMEATKDGHDPMDTLRDWLDSNNDDQLLPCRKELIWPKNVDSGKATQ